MNRGNASEIEALVALFSIIVINIGTATVTEYHTVGEEQHFGRGFVALYAGVAFIAWISMCVIISSTVANDDSGGSRMFAYDTNTIRVGRWLLFWATVSTFCFSVLAAVGEWPGQQRPVAPRLSDATPVDLTTGAPGIRIETVIGPKQFAGYVPPECLMLVTLSDNVAQDFYLLTVEVSKDVEGRTAAVAEPATAYRVSSTQSGPIRVKLRSLDDPGGMYLVELFLHPVKPNEDELVGLRPEERLSAIEELRNQIQENRTDAINQLLNQDGIEFSLE